VWHRDRDWQLGSDIGWRTQIASVKILDPLYRDDAIAVVGELSNDDERLMFHRHPKLVAMRGGEHLVRWVCGEPARPQITILGLRDVDTAAASQLGDAPFLRQIRRLIAYGPSVELAPIVSSPHLEQLETLVVFDPTDASIRAIARARLPAVRELRLLHVGGAVEHADARGFDAIVELGTSAASPIEILDIDRLSVAIDAVVANPAFGGLRELTALACKLRGCDMLGGLGELRSLRAPSSSFDDEAAIGLVRIPKLVRADLRRTSIGDAGARTIAAATMPTLKALDVSDTEIGHDGVLALARSTTLHLDHLIVSQHLIAPAVTALTGAAPDQLRPSTNLLRHLSLDAAG
jgi:hypothetical protein